MRRFWPSLFAVVLGVPSLAFILFTGAEQILSCEMNPYAGFTCPAIFAYLMPLAVIGGITIVPFLAISAIWIVFAVVSRKNR
jgi:hypothetical protein